MKSKFNPELLKEELKKFKMLTEYDFYQEKKEDPKYKDLSKLDEEENDLKPVDGDEEGLDADAKKVSNDLGLDDNQGDEENGTIPDAEEPKEEEPVEEPKPEEPAKDEETIDVTGLVKGSEEAKKAAEEANANTSKLMQQLNNLEVHVSNMDKIASKIENLEKEIIKRNPTPVEKLQMQSLNSFPYSQSLTDYWADKKGPYDVLSGENKKKEYILKKDDIDADYSDMAIKKSFSVKPKDYDEEDVNDYSEEKM